MNCLKLLFCVVKDWEEIRDIGLIDVLGQWDFG